MSAGAASRRSGRDARSRLGLAVIGSWLAGLVASGRLPAFLVALMAGLLSFAFIFTPDYPISAVTVDGMQVGDPQEVADTSGLLAEPLFHAEAAAAAENIATLPYVERVEVSLRFPGEARIVVTESVAVIALEQSGERVLVSAAGRVIALAGEEELPTLVVAGEVADTTAVPLEVVDAVRDIAAVHGDTVRLEWDDGTGLAMILGARRVIFGAPEAIDSKLAVLAAVEEQVSDTWSEIDLQEPTRPAYR